MILTAIFFASGCTTSREGVRSRNAAIAKASKLINASLDPGDLWDNLEGFAILDSETHPPVKKPRMEEKLADPILETWLIELSEAQRRWAQFPHPLPSVFLGIPLVQTYGMGEDGQPHATVSPVELRLWKLRTHANERAERLSEMSACTCKIRDIALDRIRLRMLDLGLRANDSSSMVEAALGSHTREAERTYLAGLIAHYYHHPQPLPPGNYRDGDFFHSKASKPRKS